MSNHVPEIDPQVQLKALHQALMGHKAFGRTRGKLGGSLVDLLELCLVESSPTAALNKFDAMTADIRVVLNLLAVFKREHSNVAAAELLRALTHQGYMISGETVPLQQTEPYTVFMVDPELTFGIQPFIRDWAEAYLETFLPDNWQDLKDESLMCERYGRLVWERCLRDIPWEQFRHELEGTPAHNLPGQGMRSVFNAALHAFGARLRMETTRFGHRTADLVPVGWSTRAFISLYSGPGSCYTALTGNIRPISDLACVFGKPCDQGRLLRAFHREDQARIGSWQFHLPRAMNFAAAARTFHVGFHPEAEHARWKKERPAFASRGVSHGWGALILPNADVDHVYAGEGHVLFHNRNLRDCRR